MRYDYKAQGGAYKKHKCVSMQKNVEEEYMSVKQIANFTKEDSKNETIERS